MQYSFCAVGYLCLEYYCLFINKPGGREIIKNFTLIILHHDKVHLAVKNSALIASKGSIMISL